MVAKLSFFGGTPFSSDIEEKEDEIKRTFPFAYKQSEAIRQKMLTVCCKEVRNPMVVGKFLRKENRSMEYVCSLLERDDYRSCSAFKKNYPVLFYLVGFLFEVPEFAVATLVWDPRNRYIPILHFQSQAFLPPDIRIIKKDLFQSISFDD